jgi:CheY-like chemotaxis protein
VLVVDDDEFQHRLLAQLLIEEQLELAFATSASTALAAMRKRAPELILMDVQLPDMNGIEVTQRLKAVHQFAAIPIVMITGASAKNVVMESLKAGAADFVVKPFDKDKLLAKMRHFLYPEPAMPAA